MINPEIYKHIELMRNPTQSNLTVSRVQYKEFMHKLSMHRCETFNENKIFIMMNASTYANLAERLFSGMLTYIEKNPGQAFDGSIMGVKLLLDARHVTDAVTVVWDDLNELELPQSGRIPKKVTYYKFVE